MSIKLPAGKYYMGDPCYIFNKSWMDILEGTNHFNNDPSMIKGLPVAVFYTAHGDGTYYDTDGRNYDVDAGMIGVLPVSLMKIDKVYTEKQIINDLDLANDLNLNLGMYIREFTEDFECEDEGNGQLRFGHILIDTDPEEDCDCNY